MNRIHNQHHHATPQQLTKKYANYWPRRRLPQEELHYPNSPSSQLEISQQQSDLELSQQQIPWEKSVLLNKNSPSAGSATSTLKGPARSTIWGRVPKEERKEKERQLRVGLCPSLADSSETWVHRTRGCLKPEPASAQLGLNLSQLKSLSIQLLAARTGVDRPTQAPCRLEPALTGVHKLTPL